MSNLAQIEACLEKYRKGYLEADPSLIASVFHSDVNLLSVSEGKLESYPLKQWLTSLQLRKDKGDRREGTLRMVFLELGETIATAKVELDLTSEGKRLGFTDFLSFLKKKEGWQIVGKVYEVKKFDSAN